MSIRCPRCGNTPPKDSYVCSFCGKRLRQERIENFFIFQRFEEEWNAPLGFFTKLYLLIINPAKAFWDINHKRDSSPGFLILLFNALIYGLFGLAIFSHFQITSIQGRPVNPLDITITFGYYFSSFISFFAFGLLYYLLFFWILTYFFIKGANYSIGFTERIEERFGKKAEEAEESLTTQTGVTSIFSIYKAGTLLQKQEANKYKMLFCAFTPFILIGLIKVLIVLIGMPNTTIVITYGFEVPTSVFNAMFQSPSWIALDIIDTIVLIGWIPITMTIGIRELANSSTFRVYISSVAIGTICAIVLFLLKPTIQGLI
jgi:hypothetical protein